MDRANEPLLDHLGRVMFYCPNCGGAVARADILDLGLRLPDNGETAGEYLDAELLDGVEHSQCPALAAG